MILFVDDDLRYSRNGDVSGNLANYVAELKIQLPELDIQTQRSVDEAWRLIKDRGGNFELLILDIMMPEGATFNGKGDLGRRTGVQFYKSVRERHPELPIVVLTNVPYYRVKSDFENDSPRFYWEKKELLPFEFAQEVADIVKSKEESL